MAEGDDRRVNPRTLLVGLGMGTTPERIAELQKRAAELEKLARKPPAEQFSGVLSRRAGAAPPKPRSKKDEKREALPRAAPRAKLGTPSQRAAVGRDEDDDPFVLKG